jgi:hemolysin III
MIVAQPAALPLNVELRPRLRGWLHAAVTPVAAAAAVLLVATAPGSRVAVAVYGVCFVLVFGVSAVYHRLAWNTRHAAWWQRADHSTIFLFIAASFTPFAVLSERSGWSWTLFGISWAGATVGIAIIWIRGLHPVLGVLYLSLGWMGLLVFPHLIATVGAAAVVLLTIGGVCYTAGAAASLKRRPNPWPRVFGYHEVFHLLTIVAASCQFVAVALATHARFA